MLTINDIVLVQASFARLVPMQDAAADLFYDRLFALRSCANCFRPICATRNAN